MIRLRVAHAYSTDRNLETWPSVFRRGRAAMRSARRWKHLPGVRVAVETTRANDTMGKEVELKFEVPPGGARHLASLPALRRNGGPAQENNLVSVYFDTPKHKLRKNGLSLRVRHIGNERLQTIKANGNSGAGLFSRGEWEKSIGSDKPDLRGARHSPLGSLLTKKLK